MRAQGIDIDHINTGAGVHSDNESDGEDRYSPKRSDIDIEMDVREDPTGDSPSDGRI